MPVTIGICQSDSFAIFELCNVLRQLLPPFLMGSAISEQESSYSLQNTRDEQFERESCGDVLVRGVPGQGLGEAVGGGPRNQRPEPHVPQENRPLFDRLAGPRLRSPP